MYGKEMDIWGGGCIMFELSALYPLFPGTDEADQIYRIHSILGTPNASIVARLRKHAPPQASFAFPHQEGVSLSKLLPNASEAYLDLLTRSVAYDAPERMTADQALRHHPYFVGDDTITSAIVKGKVDATNAKSRRAKIPSFIPNPAKVAGSKIASEPVQAEAEPQTTKPRSMVSILLARVRPIFALQFHNLCTSIYSQFLFCLSCLFILEQNE
jgi:renal tumor antigen